jgi:phage terminase large subunit-like protein
VKWILKHFWIPEDNFVTGERGPRPIDLQQYQIDCLNEALSQDPETGLFKYSIIVWSDIKKSAKSSLAAAVALWMAEQTDWAEIYFIANDLRQADSRVAKYARRAIQYSPSLKKKYRTRGYSIIGNMNQSELMAIPIDPSGEAGSNADMIQFSELWGAQDEAKSRMFTEMTLSPTKFGTSFRWIESYAGYVEESEVLYDLWDLGTKQGEPLWPDRLYPVINGEPTPLEVYKNEKARMFCLWNTQPRNPWQTPDYYASEASILLPNEFDRMHRNQWVISSETFVPMEWWHACYHDTVPELKPNQPCIISMDAAVSDDTFGLIMTAKHPDKDDDVVVHYARCWKPPKRGKIDFVGTPDNPGPELELRRLISENNVVEVAYDEYQLHDMASRLYREGLAFFRRFPQGGGRHSRLVADSSLRDKIRERRIHHTGFIDLNEHIQNANAKIDQEDRKVRIVKRTNKLKIDLAVCLSMAAYECHRLNL